MMALARNVAEEYAKRMAQQELDLQAHGQLPHEMEPLSHTPPIVPAQDSMQQPPHDVPYPTTPTPDYAQFIQKPYADEVPILPQEVADVYQPPSLPSPVAPAYSPSLPSVIAPSPTSFTVEPSLHAVAMPEIWTHGRATAPMIISAFALDLSGTSLSFPQSGVSTLGSQILVGGSIGDHPSWPQSLSFSNIIGAMPQDTPTVHKVIQALCCNEDAKKVGKALDLTEQFRALVQQFMDGLDDKMIDKAFKAPDGAPDILKEFLTAFAGAVKTAVAYIKKNIKDLIPTIAIPITFCPKLPCPNPGECQIKKKDAIKSEIKAAFAKDPLKKVLKKLLLEKVGEWASDIVSRALDAAFKVFPLKIYFTLRYEVNLVYDCAKDCFTSSMINVFVGLQFALEVNVKGVVDIVMALGLGPTSKIDVGTGKLNPKLRAGNGEADKESGESGPFSFKATWADWVPGISGEHDIFEDLGWKKEDRQSTFDMFEKEVTIDELKWVKKC